MKQVRKIMFPHENTDSPIEEMLYEEFKKYNLKPVPQYQVGYFYIDLAFPDIKLAIEADGHAFHSTDEQKERDKYRENRLKGLGWTFERFTGSNIYKNKEALVAKVSLKFFTENPYKLTCDPELYKPLLS